MQLGAKFKYVIVDPGVQSRTLSRALTLLEQAGLCHRFLSEKRPPRGIKVSRFGFSDDGTVVTIPLYAIERLMHWQP